MADFTWNAGKLKVEATGSTVDVTLMGGGPPKTETINRKLFAKLCGAFIKFSDAKDREPEAREAVSLPASRYQQLAAKAKAQGKGLDQLLGELIDSA